MAEIIRYGAYVPRYRAPLGEIQAFFGRPGRPRAKALATPSLDEDTLTMAYEAAVAALEGAPRPGTLITVSQTPPFRLRKLSATLARALGLDDVLPMDLAGHNGSLLDAFVMADALTASTGDPILVVATDHLVAYEDRVCDLLSAGAANAFLIGASGSGFASLGSSARASREVYDTWVLGTEREARYRLEVLAETYGVVAKEAFAALEQAGGAAIGDYAAVCVSQPHPQVMKALGKVGVKPDQLARTNFVGDLGNFAGASVGLALTLALDAAAPGDRIAMLGYGSGEAIAQELTVTGTPPTIGLAEQIADNEAISVSTYYRWTRDRQAEPL